MFLPENVRFCMDRLEQAGYAAYAVGGCVRDAALGLAPQDYDLCTAATPETIADLFSDHGLVRAGEKHGTVGVVFGKEVVEITTFRREGDYRDSRHPGWVAFVPDITEDLARRDFTVNAMAYSPTRGYADPFGGREDLKTGVLRAVGDPQLRFTEDALRILRGVRFAVKYRLQVEETTKKAMLSLAPRLHNIAAERIFEELCKLLPLVTAEDLLTFAPVLAEVIPVLGPTVGFIQHSVHHTYDVFTHTAHVGEGVAPELALRWAALLHDVGKPACFTLDEAGEGHFYGHAERSAQLADQVLRDLKAPTALRTQVTELVARHMTILEPEKKVVRRWLGRLGPETFCRLLSLQEADMGSKGTGKPADVTRFSRLREQMEEVLAENACLKISDLAVNGHDLLALGYEGPAIGQALQYLLDQVLEETLPNEKEALLRALQR